MKTWFFIKIVTDSFFYYHATPDAKLGFLRHTDHQQEMEQEMQGMKQEQLAMKQKQQSSEQLLHELKYMQEKKAVDNERKHHEIL